MATRYIITVTPKDRDPYAVQQTFDSMTEAELYAIENGLENHHVKPVEGNST